MPNKYSPPFVLFTECGKIGNKNKDQRRWWSMSLRLIYGRAGSGKSFLCLEDIKNRLQMGGDTPLILLVPEQFSLQAEKNLVKVAGSGGIMRADVLTFRRMAHRVFNEVGGITRSPMNSAGKCMILYKVIDTLRDNLQIFSKAARQPGFINTMSELIAEFKRYNVTPQQLREAGQGFRAEDLLKRKVEDLATVYEEFDGALHRQYIDADDELTLLAQRLDKSRQFREAEIWIDEFSGFTPQEYQVIEKLLQCVKRINITICTDCLTSGEVMDKTYIFSPSQYAARRLSSLAERNNIPVDKPIRLDPQEKILPRFKESLELAHLEKNYFAFPYSIYKQETTGLSIFSSVSIYSEVEDTARDILHRVRDEGLRYRDITVVTRNLEAYKKLIAALFSQHGIPYFIDTKRDLNSHPLVMMINAALEIFNSHWSYETVFRYVKTGLTNISREEADLLENYALAWGIRGNRWTQGEWNYSVLTADDDGRLPEKEQELLRKINEIRSRLVDPLWKFRSKVRGRKSAREFCAGLYEFLCDIGVPDRMETWITRFRDQGQLDFANEYSQVWNIVMDVFDQVVEVMGDEGITLDKFARILSIGFGEYKTGLIPPALDQVLVGSIERSKSHEVKALYILGVNDGVFPSAGSEEGILSDRDRVALKESRVELAQDTRTRAFEEQFLVYRALSTSGKYLRLSYPIANHEGRSLRPSIIISRIKKIFPGIRESSNIIAMDTDEENLSLLAAPAPVFHQLVSTVRRNWEGISVNPLWWDVYKWYVKDEQWQQKCDMALSGLHYTNQSARISPEKVGDLYGSPVYSSVSRLERYATCPFSYYIQYGLKAKDRKIFKLSAPDLGTFMHEVLDEFARHLDRTGMTWRTCTREWCTEVVSEIVEQLLMKMGSSILNSSQRYRYLAGRLKRVLSRAVWLIAEHMRKSGFEPIGYEMAFGEKERFAPITIVLPSGQEIKLTGRIDRLDAMRTEEGTYLRIVDYKSGSKAFKLSDVYYGLQIQLITYLDAVWENETEDLPKPILPGGILYFRIDDPVVRGAVGIQEEEIEKSIMKQLKMKGLLLADVKLIKEMDREIDGDSLIIPARINKGDVLGRSSAATLEQFHLLRRYVKKLLARIGEEMLSGDVSISPYKKKRVTSCQYCSYSAICQFDPSLKDNKYKMLKDFKDDEVWEKVNEELRIEN